MGALEAVFNSTKFDLNDEVLMRFDDYFDKRDRALSVFLYALRKLVLSSRSVIFLPDG